MRRHRLLCRLLALTLLPALIVGCDGAQIEPAPPTPLPPPTSTPLSPSPSATNPHQRIDLDEGLYVRQIQEGAFVITHAFPWPGNSMIVAVEGESGDGALVLVDTPYTPEATRVVLDWAEAHFGQREIVAINTGYHYDNLGGNGYLVERSIPVYGSDLSARLLAERGEQMRAQTLDWLNEPGQERYREAHAELDYVPPTHLFPLEEGLELRFGDETVQVYYPGPTHAPDNVVVYFSERKILFGGCMILGWDGLGNTSDADMQAWPRSVRKLSGFDFDVLVPGHGDRLDPGLLQHTVDILTGG